MSMTFIEHQYYVYIMSNRSKTIYTGMTNGLRKRVIQHKLGINEGFTKRYKIDRLVYWESYQYVRDAFAREKEIKGWLRIKKIQLIVSMNPTWKDLSLELWPELEAEMRQIKKALEEERKRRQALKPNLANNR